MTERLGTKLSYTTSRTLVLMIRKLSPAGVRAVAWPSLFWGVVASEIRGTTPSNGVLGMYRSTSAGAISFLLRPFRKIASPTPVIRPEMSDNVMLRLVFGFAGIELGVAGSAR